MTRERPASDPSWSHYPGTVLEIRSGGETAYGAAPVLEVDLREPLGDGVAGRLRALGLGECWGVVTAYNPHGRSRDSAANAARHARLEKVVRKMRVPYAQADGRSPDGSHREVGLAIALPQSEAVALAARFGQSAIFWFDGSAFWLVAAVGSADPVRLPPVPGG